MTESSKTENSFPDSPAFEARGLALWEIASVVTSCLIAEWVMLSFAGRSKLTIAIPTLLALGLMYFSHRERGETFSDIGFRTDNFLAACRLLLLPTAIVVALIIVLGWLTSHSISLAPWLTASPAVAAVGIVSAVCSQRFHKSSRQLAFGKGPKSVMLVAIVFSLFRTEPAARHSDVCRRLDLGGCLSTSTKPLCLGLSHAFSSLTLALVISPKLLESLRVGFKYFG